MSNTTTASRRSIDAAVTGFAVTGAFLAIVRGLRILKFENLDFATVQRNTEPNASIEDVFESDGQYTAP